MKYFIITAKAGSSKYFETHDGDYSEAIEKAQFLTMSSGRFNIKEYDSQVERDNALEQLM